MAFRVVLINLEKNRELDWPIWVKYNLLSHEKEVLIDYRFGLDATYKEVCEIRMVFDAEELHERGFFYANRWRNSCIKGQR